MVKYLQNDNCVLSRNAYKMWEMAVRINLFYNKDIQKDIKAL